MGERRHKMGGGVGVGGGMMLEQDLGDEIWGGGVRKGKKWKEGVEGRKDLGGGRLGYYPHS